MRKPGKDGYLGSLNCFQEKKQQPQLSLTLLGWSGKHYGPHAEEEPSL
jgi:hypothetical protein